MVRGSSRRRLPFPLSLFFLLGGAVVVCSFCHRRHHPSSSLFASSKNSFPHSPRTLIGTPESRAAFGYVTRDVALPGEAIFVLLVFLLAMMIFRRKGQKKMKVRVCHCFKPSFFLANSAKKKKKNLSFFSSSKQRRGAPGSISTTLPARRSFSFAPITPRRASSSLV